MLVLKVLMITVILANMVAQALLTGYQVWRTVPQPDRMEPVWIVSRGLTAFIVNVLFFIALLFQPANPGQLNQFTAYVVLEILVYHFFYGIGRTGKRPLYD